MDGTTVTGAVSGNGNLEDLGGSCDKTLGVLLEAEGLTDADLMALSTNGGRGDEAAAASSSSSPRGGGS